MDIKVYLALVQKAIADRTFDWPDGTVQQIDDEKMEFLLTLEAELLKKLSEK